MMKFGKLHEKDRNDSGVSKIYFSRNNNSPRDKGQLSSQKYESHADKFEVPLLLNVDDAVLIFISRDDLGKGVEMACNVFKLIGLEMHTKHDKVKSNK